MATPGVYSPAGQKAMSEVKIVTYVHTNPEQSSDPQQAHEYAPASFVQCILDNFGKQDMETVYFDLIDSKVFLNPGSPVDRDAVKKKFEILDDDKSEQNDAPWLNTPVVISHPPFCSFHHMTEDEKSRIPEVDRNRGVNVGVAVILESKDNFVLLTRRASHMRTFANCWVPPGGHVDEGETLYEGALREVFEETGLELRRVDGLDLKVLGIREGAYPVSLHSGLPRRHHLIFYIYCRVPAGRVELNQKLRLNPEEVGGSVWVTRGLVENIRNDRIRTGFRRESFATLVNKNGKQWSEPIQVSQLLQERVGDFRGGGQLSTGTKFALDLWLAMKEEQQLH